MATTCHVIPCKETATISDGAHHAGDDTVVPTCQDHAMGPVELETPLPARCPKFVRRDAKCTCPPTKRDARRYAVVDDKVVRADQGPISGTVIILPQEQLGGFNKSGAITLLAVDDFELLIEDR